MKGIIFLPLIFLLIEFTTSGNAVNCGSIYLCPEGYQCLNNRCVYGLPDIQDRVNDGNIQYYDTENGVDYSQIIIAENNNSS